MLRFCCNSFIRFFTTLLLLMYFLGVKTDGTRYIKGVEPLAFRIMMKVV